LQRLSKATNISASKEGCRAGIPTGLGVGPTVGCCEQGNEHSVGIKGGETFGQLREYQLIKRDYTLLRYQLSCQNSRFLARKGEEKKTTFELNGKRHFLCKLFS